MPWIMTRNCWRDFMSGEDEKRDGIRRVSAKNRIWLDRGILLADAYLPHGNVMGEDLQKIPGIGQPTSPNAWGALTQNCVRAGILIKTGSYRKAKLTTNHAHRYEIYWRPGHPNPGAKLLDAPPPISPQFSLEF